MKIEVCVDNLASLHTAVRAGADRIELCSSLPLGGLTPSAGLMQQAARLSLPVYAMIRPRAGNFSYSSGELALMSEDIRQARRYGLAGVVFGVVDEQGEIDRRSLGQLCQVAASEGLKVTFHRAFDVCRNWPLALEVIIDAGCERLLSSGQAPTAEQGADTLQQMVQQAAGRIAIMAGAGISAANARQIAEQSQVDEVHLSGMEWVDSPLPVSMGSSDQGRLNMTSYQRVAAVVSQFSDPA